MSSRGVAIQYDDNQVRRAIDSLRAVGKSPRPLMRQIGAYFAGETTKNFRDARKLYPPKPRHWAEWLGRSTPLHGQTGKSKSFRLAQSITHEEPTDSSTRVGSPLPYAAAQNFGAQTNKRFALWIQPKRTPKGKISRFRNGLPHGKLIGPAKRGEAPPEPGAIKVFMRQNIRKRQFIKQPTQAQAEEIKQRTVTYLQQKLEGGL